VIARGFAPLRRALPLLLEDRDNGLSAVMRELLGEIGERLRFIDDRLRQRLFRQDERCQRVAAVEGVGPVTATALVAAVGNATEFRSGRELAAYLGLVPRHRASGGRTVLLGISKRGDRYLRTLLIHGARSALHRIERHRGARAMWPSGSTSWWSQGGGGGAGQQERQGAVGPAQQRAELSTSAVSRPASPKPVVEGTRAENGFTNPEIAQAVA
jgi:hypothetical protein